MPTKKLHLHNLITITPIDQTNHYITLNKNNLPTPTTTLIIDFKGIPNIHPNILNITFNLLQGYHIQFIGTTPQIETTIKQVIEQYLTENKADITDLSKETNKNNKKNKRKNKRNSKVG